MFGSCFTTLAVILVSDLREVPLQSDCWLGLKGEDHMLLRFLVPTVDVKSEGTCLSPESSYKHRARRIEVLP